MIVRRIIATLALLVCLGAVNWSIYQKEQHLKHGQVVFLELAPVDPRSLMQGDYMALRFKLANQISAELYKRNEVRDSTALMADDGHALVTLDEKRVAEFGGIYRQQTLGPKQLAIQYRRRNGELKFATNAFFFQEGHAERYESAKFGKFRVDENGELLLTSLHNERLENLALLDTTQDTQ